MSENVIERLIEALGRKEDLLDDGTIDNHSALWSDGRAYGVHEAAKQLQAATRPEQFMPRLDEWPEDAEWCAVRTSGPASFFRHKPIPMTDGNWSPEYDDDFVSADWSVPDIPLGIDWRTCKVSREQMAEWEANQ